MKTKTISGNDVEINPVDRKLSISQGTFEYEGPYMFHQDGVRCMGLKINVNGQTATVAIPEAVGREIALQQKEISQQQLERIAPGLAELRAAHDAEASYLYNFDRMMSDESNDGVNAPSVPAANTDDLSKKYPRAALYLKAEGYSDANSPARRSAGKKAMEMFLSGATTEDIHNALCHL